MSITIPLYKWRLYIELYRPTSDVFRRVSKKETKWIRNRLPRA